MQGALSRWRDVSGQKRKAALKADLMYEARAISSAFIKWTAASAQAIDNRATADKAYTFFTLRSTFKRWGQKHNNAIVQRKQAGMTERRRKNDLKASMNGGY